MDTSFDGTIDSARAAGRGLKNDAGNAASDIKSVASGEIKNLIADVEDLVARIADLKDADVARVRGRVMNALGSAKSSLNEGAQGVKRRARYAASSADDYVRGSPWTAVGIAAAVGAVVGILAARRS